MMPSDEHRVLLLPATRRDGQAIVALLETQQISCQICLDVAEAVAAIDTHPGVLLLTEQIAADAAAAAIPQALGRQPAWSDLPVVFLSRVGAETREMAHLVSQMTNVTLLERPSSVRTLISAIQAALRSRAKQYQMRDQLQALHAAEKALRESDVRKDEFLAMLGHELRNPLAPIRTAADLLPRLIASGDPRAITTVNIVNRQVKQLIRLVDDLLDVSRITRGRIQVERMPVQLDAVIAQALESVDSAGREKRHTINTTLNPDIWVDGDNARLVQCVSNVLMNAVKYTDAGGQIQVELKSDGVRALLTVADNGVGIAPELLPKIFELFVQDERSLDRSQGGLGIGLSVVSRLVEMHGGEVSAHSRGIGLGSTFTIGLPQIPAPEHHRTDSAQAFTPARRVLVVDDNQDAADSLVMLLAAAGHTAEAVYDPHEALQRAPLFHADYILLDIGLPAMDGYEVARRLRAASLSAQLVALTGYGQKEDGARALSAGFHSHLVKPVAYDQLETLLRTHDESLRH